MLLSAVLTAAGHVVHVTNDPGEASALVAGVGADLVVLDVLMPKISGYELLAELRKNPATRATPALFLSARGGGEDRVRGLRAGASDYLTKPFEPDELVLRVERLLQSRLVAEGGLAGDLRAHPLGEILQSLGQRAKTGTLTITSRGREGWLALERGEIVQGAWGRLRALEAALALLELEEGQFRFDELHGGGGGAAVGGEPVAAPALLMHAAWLEDELGNRRTHLPRGGEPLAAVGSAPEPPEAYRRLPIGWVHATLRARSGLSLDQLAALGDASRRSLWLAVAWLTEAGAVLRAPEGSGAGIPSRAPTDPADSDAADALDAALRDLFQAAVFAGIETNDVKVVVVCQAEAWNDLLDLLAAAAPEGTGTGGFAVSHELGRLELDVRLLPSSSAPEGTGLPSTCVGVALWLAPTGSDLPLLGFVRDVEAAAREIAGTLVAPGRAEAERAAWLKRGTRRWRIAPRAPASLAELLRLLS